MRSFTCFAAFAILLAHSSVAQEKTYGGRQDNMVKLHNALGTIVIVPFEDRMYLSDADAHIGRETGLQPGELEVKFRHALLESLEKELQKDWDINVMYEDRVREKGFDLTYVHASLQYNFVAVPGEVMMENDTSLTRKEIRSKKPKGESGVKNGQVVTVSDETERFMNLAVINDTLMNYLVHNSPSDYYLFINEFDIRHYISDPDRIASGGLSYQLKVHFSCLDKDGRSSVSGAATTLVNAGSSNIYEVIKAGIPNLTKKMARMIRKFNAPDQR